MTNKQTFSNTRKTSFNLDKLRQKVQKGKNKDKEDNRFWKLTVDKEQNGEATIRLLPGIIETEDDLPAVQTYQHIFKGVGGTFWEHCPNMVSRLCPICAKNSELYKIGTDDAKAIASKRKKQEKWISNILVIDDKGNPENNGKVFLFEYGPDLLQRFMAQVDIDEADEGPLPKVNPYSVEADGADFKLVSFKNNKGYRDYSKSFYKKPNALKVENVDAVLAQQHRLKEFVDPAKVKSDEDLLKRFDKVTKQAATASSTETSDVDETVGGEMSVDGNIPEMETAEDPALDVDDAIKKLLGGEN